MKKLHLNATLVVGVLSAGSVFAQSNAEVYGLVDVLVASTSKAGKDGGDMVRVGSGGMNTSRLGFRGSEDLGDGLKAVYQLEMGISADTGVSDNPLFKRQANVGLEGRYGRVIIGRSFTSVYDFMVPYDPMEYAPYYSWVPAGNASGGPSRSGMTAAFDNIVKYTGKFGKFKFGASYGAGEQTSTSDSAKGAVAASYTSGPYSVVATYERENGNTLAGTAARDVSTVSYLGAMYSSGGFKLQAGARNYKLEAGKAATADVRARLYWAGANYQLTPVVTLTGAVYYQDVLGVPAHIDADPAMFVGRIRYALSKRTDLYMVAAYARAKNNQLVSVSREDVGYGRHQRSLVVGLQHRF